MAIYVVRNKRVLPTFVLLVGIFIVSCTISKYFSENGDSKFPSDPRVDRSFITGQPCEAPCWYGLRLGESTVDDIRNTLSGLQFVDNPRIHEQPTGNFMPDEKLFIVPCVYSTNSEGCAELETSADGKLHRVILHIDYDLRLRSVIQQLGDPEYYTANPSPNKDICSFEIYWPTKNIVAVIDETPKKKHCSVAKNEPIDLDLQVASLVYVEINTQQKYEVLPWPNNSQ